jgi:hypothetical protein
VVHFCHAFFQRCVGDQWNALARNLKEYWIVYGGWRAFWASPVLWTAFLVNAILYPLWIRGTWADAAISILPNVLGLSIGAMAIILAFPTTRIFSIMTEDGRTDSFYLDLSSRLTHFIVIQVVALIFALMGKAYEFTILSFIGCWFLVYAILTAGVISL